jgi:signal transduction histidine kinase
VSIRLRVTLTTVLLAALAVGGAQATTFYLLSSYFDRRADASVREVAQAAVAALGNGRTLSLSTFSRTDRPVLIEVRNSRGAVQQRLSTAEAARVKVPSGLLARMGHSQQLHTSGDHAPTFEVLALRAPGGRTVVAAVSLKDVVGTLDHLRRLTIIVSLVALALSGMVAALVLTRSLRPLRRIATTADAIAAGDLGARVPTLPRRSEIGRVATAMNRMLGENEAAFAQRDATEARLRRFLADASHELRTPLTSIRGYAELFRRGAGQSPEGDASDRR